jgi:hypothetical protein
MIRNHEDIALRCLLTWGRERGHAVFCRFLRRRAALWWAVNARASEFVFGEPVWPQKLTQHEWAKLEEYAAIRAEALLRAHP